jgi:RNA polymerase sigma-70 factor (ECF subfamily)
MEQRLTRARARLRARGDPDGVEPARSRERLDAVCRVIHLLFNEGYWSSDSAMPIRAGVCRLAIGLARSLAEVFPDDAEALGLLALLLFHDARRVARHAADGTSLPLPEQDRKRWDRRGIAEATELLEHAVALGEPGPYQLEAAISATHCDAEHADDTRWSEIADLYARLEALRPTPAVRVSHAFAVARARGAEAGLALLDVNDEIRADTDPYVHLVRGVLLAELGERDRARASLRAARDVARNPVEGAQIDDRIAALDREEPAS